MSRFGRNAGGARLTGTVTALASPRVRIKDTTVYEGAAIAVPRVGDDIHHDGQVVRIEAVVWDFGGADGVVSVALVMGGQPYTF